MVFNAIMVSRALRALVCVVGVLALPSVAGAESVELGQTAPAAPAKSVEVGQTTTPLVAPSCPPNVALSDCRILLTHTTAIQTKSDSVSNATRVKQPGWVVAFSVGLSDLVSDPTQEHNLLHSLNGELGGTPQVALTVLRPGPKNSYRVVSQSAIFHVTPFLGRVLEEPLSLPNTFTAFTALRVTPGEVIGLTTPTWAPVLTYDLANSQFGYRQSRRANCENPPAGETALTTVGQSAAFLCAYTGTRVEYSATEITNTPYPKKYVH